MADRITKKMLYDKLDLLNSITNQKYVIRHMYDQYYIYTEQGHSIMAGTIKELFYQIVFAIRILNNCIQNYK